MIAFWFSSAAITKLHSLGGLMNRILLSHRSGGLTPEIKASSVRLGAQVLFLARLDSHIFHVVFLCVLITDASSSL